MTTAKIALDKLINKSRVHFYKPIQVAEILYRNRLGSLSLAQLENYRTVSRRWRNDVSLRIVGSESTSSSRFQDNIFDDNAIPPNVLRDLGEYNKANDGIVEAYIYLSLLNKMNDLGAIHDFLSSTSIEDFNLQFLLDLFGQNAGLRRSMDKVYEIVAYALLESIIHALDVRINVSVHSSDSSLIAEFSDFTEKVIGLSHGKQLETTAKVFRVGATNANDGGLDLWANYGPAIQVKHFNINSGHLNSITATFQAEKFIVICMDADKDIIESVLKQSGTFPKVQSIVTLNDLSGWYDKVLSERYRSTIGTDLLQLLLSEFEFEFPSNKELPLFLSERGYDQLELPADWNPVKDELA